MPRIFEGVLKLRCSGRDRNLWVYYEAPAPAWCCRSFDALEVIETFHSRSSSRLQTFDALEEIETTT
jgi:hypothetical protein